VLDFGGNVKRHGPVDRLEATKPRAKSEGGDAAAKECPECHELIACGYAVCPQCGYEFPQPERAKHETTASNEGVLSGEVIVTTHEVRDTFYSVHVKKNASSDAPRTVRVDYMVDDSLWPKSEWICFEHTPGSFPQKKAATWWRMRSPDPVPLSCDAAIDAIDGGALAETLGITVRRVTGDKFERVIDYVLGSKPEPMEFGAPRRLTLPVGADEDIPF
jgi:DNA repair protein RadD